MAGGTRWSFDHGEGIRERERGTESERETLRKATVKTQREKETMWDWEQKSTHNLKERTKKMFDN